jgi:hypothetical protein
MLFPGTNRKTIGCSWGTVKLAVTSIHWLLAAVRAIVGCTTRCWLRPEKVEHIVGQRHVSECGPLYSTNYLFL